MMYVGWDNRDSEKATIEIVNPRGRVSRSLDFLADYQKL